jgi:hypothetical protein
MNDPDTQRAAAQRAQALVETIQEIGVAGSLRHIAAALSKRGVPTPKGGRWHSTSVGRLLDRNQRQGEVGKFGSERHPFSLSAINGKLRNASVFSTRASDPLLSLVEKSSMIADARRDR